MSVAVPEGHPVIDLRADSNWNGDTWNGSGLTPITTRFPSVPSTNVPIAFASGAVARIARQSALTAKPLAIFAIGRAECWTADERLWNTVKREVAWVRGLASGMQRRRK